MKSKLHKLWALHGSHLFFGFFFAGALGASAQIATNFSMPVVTIWATDPLASWAGKTGTFTAVRAGPTNATLNIYYSIVGTATNGADYTQIGNWVTIPAGERTNSIAIDPINNGQSATETVKLHLTASPLMIPINYIIGEPDTAVVYITPTFMTNIPPTVAITTPPSGATFAAPANIPVCAYAFDPDGYVATVEFFAGTTSLGIRTNNPASASPVNPFCLLWSNVPPGNYSLTAVATDNGGASTTSDPVNVSVKTVPPPTNVPPIVSLISPQNGATFFTPVDIRLFAKAADPDGSVSNVEFFAGTTDLGPGMPLVLDPPGVDGYDGLVYVLVWSNVPPSNYTLTAVATDNGGASTTSAGVNISVQTGPPPPPPTNYPPLVRISSPPNGAVFRTPADVPIFAYAKDPDGSVASVEFFAGTNDLGAGQTICLTASTPMLYCPSNVFFLVWSNPPVGLYPLTAVATDNGGAMSTSPPVNITILPSPPPPTNRPPIVSIAATDPLAIEGTNCWPWVGLTNPAPTWGNWATAISFRRFFTNCGPKDATFTVRRFGDTNDDLVVSYDIGGSATNGVDYVPLAGSVTIPAGERRAQITVVPLDDGPPDITSTVVLKLAPGTNYLMGFPTVAAAVILDSGSPRPITGMLPGDCFSLSAGGPDGAWFHIEYSTDLLRWTPICTNQVVDGLINFVDPDAAADSARFYRAVPESGPPSE